MLLGRKHTCEVPGHFVTPDCLNNMMEAPTYEELHDETDYEDEILSCSMLV